MDRAPSASPIYLFEKFEPGIIALNAKREVVSMNDYARRVLPVQEMRPFERFVLDFHPERSRPKVEFLLDQASACPVAGNVPMTMIINIPEQVLLIKVSRMSDSQGELTGFVLVFYDVTQVVSEESMLASHARRLSRVPTTSQQQVAFVDADKVRCIESQGHYCRVRSDEGWQFCNLSIGDLQARLDPAQFHRVHRCFMVNLAAVDTVEREGNRTQLLLRNEPRLVVPVSRTEVSDLRSALGLRAKRKAVKA
jgi:hypothetical protein